MNQQVGQTTVGVLFPIIVMIVILLLIIAFCFRMVILTSKAKSIAKKQQKNDKMDGVGRFDNIIHIGGLNVPENCKCSSILSPENLTISCGGNELVLKISKIRNVDFQLDIDEKQFLKSSLAKGIVGAAAFGVSGAIIGSAPKTQTKREVKCYAIISYEDSQGNYKTFILRDELANTSRCAKLVDALRPMIQSKTNRVEL